jgi:hypothetical protein
MDVFPEVFAPIEARLIDGYVMPMMGERSIGDAAQLQQALTKLKLLWHGCGKRERLSPYTIDEHHTLDVVPLARDGLIKPLMDWYYAMRNGSNVSHVVDEVHGDATLENIMVYEGRAVWIDPSTRRMPAYAEFDCAKLLQTHFGYGAYQPELGVDEFVKQEAKNKVLTGYFLMTHLVRLYKVQPQARAWALDVANTLGPRLEEVYR